MNTIPTVFFRSQLDTEVTKRKWRTRKQYSHYAFFSYKTFCVEIKPNYFRRNISSIVSLALWALTHCKVLSGPLEFEIYIQNNNKLGNMKYK